ncbi:hypothetical protein ACHAPJ_009202 [Fusarium lateritium]
MVEWRFKTVGNIVTERELLGTNIPPEWQMWEEAYFKRVNATLADPNHTALLIEDGCNNGDSEELNCTKTCDSAEYMFKSPQNLWNCMTLSTVAMKVVPEPTNDTVNRDSENEMRDKFHFGSLRDFQYPFGKVRKCLWQSCSDSKYGTCTPDLVNYQCDLINQFTVEKFGAVLTTSYCRNADPGIDSDLVGQGVLIAYIIQHLLVFFFGLSFGLTCKWTRENVWVPVGEIWSKGSSSASGARSQKAHGIIKWLIQLRSQFPSAIVSTLVDLQEAQALFTATISFAAIIAFHGYLGLANIVSISSYVLNNEVALGVMIIGMSPLFLLQVSLDASGNASKYTLVFVFLNWFLILLKQILQRTQGASKFEAHLKDLSSVSACGDNPGAMSYCMNYGGVEDGVQARIDQDEYVVLRRETTISESQSSEESISEGDSLIKPVDTSGVVAMELVQGRASIGDSSENRFMRPRLSLNAEVETP